MARRLSLAVPGLLVALFLLVGVSARPASAAPTSSTTSAAALSTPASSTAGRLIFADPTAPTITVPTPTPPADPIKPLIDNVNKGGTSPLTVVLLLGVVSLVPALLMMVTAFTRIVIVLGFTRNALGTQTVPPNQVIIGLALFLTLFVMGPTFGQINKDAVQPVLRGQISTSQAWKAAQPPLKNFMLKQVREKDLALFVKLSGKPKPKNQDDLALPTVVPAFVLSELHTAFLIGFLIFVPFLVIDFVVSAALSSLGMVMLPPALISLPFKLLLFVAADGWYLVVSSLVQSFK